MGPLQAGAESIDKHLRNAGDGFVEVMAEIDAQMRQVDSTSSPKTPAEGEAKTGDEQIPKGCASRSKSEEVTADDIPQEGSVPNTGAQTDKEDFAGRSDQKDNTSDGPTRKRKCSSPLQSPVFSVGQRHGLIMSDFFLLNQVEIRRPMTAQGASRRSVKSPKIKGPQNKTLWEEIAFKKKFVRAWEIELGRTEAHKEDKFNYAISSTTKSPCMNHSRAVEAAWEFLNNNESMHGLRIRGTKMMLANAMVGFAMDRFDCGLKGADLVSGAFHKIGHRSPEEGLVYSMDVAGSIAGLKEIVVTPSKLDDQGEVEYMLLASRPSLDDERDRDAKLPAINELCKRNGRAARDHRLFFGLERKKSEM